MFAVYFTRKKQRLLCCFGAVALVLGGYLLLKGAIANTAASVVFSDDLNLKNADTNAARVEFLAGLGWKTSDEPVEVRLAPMPSSPEFPATEVTLAELVHGDRPLCRALLGYSPR